MRNLLHGRLEIVGESARQILAATAVLGRSFDFDMIRDRTEQGRGYRDPRSASGAQLIEEVQSGAPNCHFSHEKLRSLVSSETSLGRQRLLQRRTAAALASWTRG